MTNRKFRPSTPGVVADGMFDQLSGAPWKAAPKGDYTGFVIPALETLKHYDSDETGEATFGLGEVELAVRVIGQFADLAGRSLRVMQFTCDEFEVLALLTEDVKHAHLSFRGSKIALIEAAELLRVEADKAKAKFASVYGSQGEVGS